MGGLETSYEGCTLFTEKGCCYCSTGLYGTCEAPPVAYGVDHRKSCPDTFVYCVECYEQIPGFLVRRADPITGPQFSRYTEEIDCAGCGSVLHEPRPER